MDIFLIIVNSWTIIRSL